MADSFEGQFHKAMSTVEPGGELRFVGSVQDFGIDHIRSLRNAIFIYAPACGLDIPDFWRRKMADRAAFPAIPVERDDCVFHAGRHWRILQAIDDPHGEEAMYHYDTYLAVPVQDWLDGFSPGGVGMEPCVIRVWRDR